MAEQWQLARSGAKASGAMLCLLVLTACSNPLVEDTSREVAKGAVNDVVSTRFPGVNAAPYTDCIIDNASTDEILSLAQSALTNNTNAAANTVLTIAGRPGTSTCIAESALTSLLG